MVFPTIRTKKANTKMHYTKQYEFLHVKEH